MHFNSITVTNLQDDDFDAEEWERYEALHDDVDNQVSIDFLYSHHNNYDHLADTLKYIFSSNQERTKERLFEEEMEVVWDKGSSGLVFYTDASHWDQLDGGY